MKVLGGRNLSYLHDCMFSTAIKMNSNSLRITNPKGQPCFLSLDSQSCFSKPNPVPITENLSQKSPCNTQRPDTLTCHLLMTVAESNLSLKASGNGILIPFSPALSNHFYLLTESLSCFWKTSMTIFWGH